MQLLNKVRDYLKKEKRYDFADEKWTGEMLGIVYDAVYATEAVMSEPKSSQWISVTDRLPDHENNVLAVLDGKVCVMAYISFKDNGHTYYAWGYSYDGISGDAIRDEDYYPSHWMPLPSPPQQ